MVQALKRYAAGLMILGVMIPLLAACGQAQPQVIRETVVVQGPTAAPQVVRETVVVKETAEPAATEGQAAFTTPHPALSDLKVRQAIAYCTNRPELIASVYPFLSAEEQQKLVMDTNIPQGHWAQATEGITRYPFDLEKGKQLLNEAGWKLAEGATVRANEAGDRMSLSFTTTNAQFRQTWSQVFIKQMSGCGIEIIPTYAPGSWWFGSTTGLRRRDFELGAYAWVGETDPGGQTLYACNQIPLPSNGWQGQNYMGWCNETASKAILAANANLEREERIKQYATFQQEFTRDMVSLPLFNRAEVGAWNANLTGLEFDPTEYYTRNAGEWELKGGDTVVLGFTQEPATMWTLIESAAVQRTASYLTGNDAAQGFAFTAAAYDYQAGALTKLPRVGEGAINEEVEVKAGDKVWTSAGELGELKAGTEVTNAAGETVKYESGTVKMKQLTVTFDYQPGIKWSDGEPLSKADFELGYKIDCDKDSGATTYLVCDSMAGVEFTSDTSYTITYLPGAQWPEYFVQTLTAYPAHRVIESEGAHKGKKLAEVPAKDWSTLKEITEAPLSVGPYVLTSWEKGQRMTFEANPNYYKGAPKVKKIVIQFVSDTNQAVAQLLTGEIDVLGTETLGAGAEVQTVLDAVKAGKAIQTRTIANPTWEHIDFNLYVK